MSQSFFELKPEMYPFTITFLEHATGLVRHTLLISGPGGARVPGNEELGGNPIGVHVKYANGHEQYNAPPQCDGEPMPDWRSP